MRVAVTGASGYIGSLLVEAHAARGDDVHALTRERSRVAPRPGVTVHEGDLTDPASLPEAFFDAEILYHCAAEIALEARMRALNVEGTRHALERARGKVAHWVQLSSLSVYGTPRRGVVDESTPPNPRSLYAATKLEADALVVAHARDRFTCTLLRPAAVIGPRMTGGSMRALVAAVRSGRFAFIGNPGAIGNYVHEGSLTDAMLLCAMHPAAHGRTYNVCENVPLERMIGTIAAALGAPTPRWRLPEALARTLARCARFAPGFPLTAARVDALTSRVEYSSERIRRELGFEFRHGVEEALRALCEARAPA